MKVYTVLAVLLLASQLYSSKTFRVVESSNEVFNQALQLSEREVLLIDEEPEGLKLQGTCNRCSISEKGCGCTKMFCVTETTPSESVVCALMTSKNI